MLPTAYSTTVHETTTRTTTASYLGIPIAIGQTDSTDTSAFRLAAWLASVADSNPLLFYDEINVAEVRTEGMNLKFLRILSGPFRHALLHPNAHDRCCSALFSPASLFLQRIVPRHHVIAIGFHNPTSPNFITCRGTNPCDGRQPSRHAMAQLSRLRRGRKVAIWLWTQRQSLAV